MGVTGGVPYGFDLGTKAGTPGGPFIEGINQGVVGMQARACLRLLVPIRSRALTRPRAAAGFRLAGSARSSVRCAGWVHARHAY